MQGSESGSRTLAWPAMLGPGVLEGPGKELVGEGEARGSELPACRVRGQCWTWGVSGARLAVGCPQERVPWGAWCRGLSAAWGRAFLDDCNFFSLMRNCAKCGGRLHSGQAGRQGWILSRVLPGGRCTPQHDVCHSFACHWMASHPDLPQPGVSCLCFQKDPPPNATGGRLGETGPSEVWSGMAMEEAWK